MAAPLAAGHGRATGAEGGSDRRGEMQRAAVACRREGRNGRAGRKGRIEGPGAFTGWMEGQSEGNVNPC